MPRYGKGWELTCPRRMGESRHIQPIYPGKVTNSSPKNWPPAKSFEPKEKNIPLFFFWGWGGVRVPMDVKIISRMYLVPRRQTLVATCHPCWLPRLGPLSQLQEINYLCDPRHGRNPDRWAVAWAACAQLTLVGLFVFGLYFFFRGWNKHLNLPSDLGIIS